jgi:glycosyltransferase involved in cell wall biosynthesis
MPRIFYWMTDTPAISGGEKHSYEHVDLLNAAGFEAYALHLAGERYRWFDNQTAVIHGPGFWEMFDARRDYLVLPENLGRLIGGLPGRKVIFNKNLYQGFRALDAPGAARSPYDDPRVVAIFSVSEHNVRHLRYAFPHADVVRVYAALDSELHYFRSLDQKKRQIAVVCKSPEPLSVLMQTLNARASAGLNNLRDYDIRWIRDLSFRDAAQVIGESLLLVSLSTHEGLPRTVLEGMACGCIVAAYGTGPLHEILPREYAFEPDDLIGMARHIEAVAAAFPDRMDVWAPTIERARVTAAAFTRERQRDVLLAAWRRIIATHASGTAAETGDPAPLLSLPS